MPIDTSIPGTLMRLASDILLVRTYRKPENQQQPEKTRKRGSLCGSQQGCDTKALMSQFTSSSQLEESLSILDLTGFLETLITASDPKRKKRRLNDALWLHLRPLKDGKLVWNKYRHELYCCKHYIIYIAINLA
jgi:hypothetical protein